MYKIMATNMNIYKCKDIFIYVHNKEDYSNNYWICTANTDMYILGCYDSLEKARKVVVKLKKHKGVFPMPLNKDVK